MKLPRYLSALGYGTRREVEQLLASGAVRDEAGRVLRKEMRMLPNGTPSSPARPPAPLLSHTSIRVHGEPLDPPPGSVVLLHKPAGTVCSTTDPNPVVYDLLPPRFRARSPIVAPVGRLDRDTTGLLLLTDNGALLHRITSPRSHLPKRYRATLAEPFDIAQRHTLTNGTLVLSGEDAPLAPAELEVVSEREVRLTITEGRYHQVRRMLAAVGHHVAALHRESLGPLALDDLAEGQWRVLGDDEVLTLERALVEKRSLAKGTTAARTSLSDASDESLPAP